MEGTSNLKQTVSFEHDLIITQGDLMEENVLINKGIVQIEASFNSNFENDEEIIKNKINILINL